MIKTPVTHRGPRTLSKMKNPPVPKDTVVAQTPVAAKYAPGRAVKVRA